MRTLRTIIRAATLVAILAAAAHGRDMAGKIGITPQLGLIIPAGELGEQRDIGVKQGLELEYFVTDNVLLGLRWFHDGFPNRGALARTHFSFGHCDKCWPINGLEVQAKYYRQATPFTDIFGRIGFLLSRIEFPIHRRNCLFDCEPWYSRETATSAGLEAGIGISRHLSKHFAVYGEVEYSLLFTKGLEIKKEPTAIWYGYSCWYNTQMVAIKTGLTFYFGGSS